MNGYPSNHRVTIWVEDTKQFGESWDILLAKTADVLYPAHGRPFASTELRTNRYFIDKVKLYPLR